MGTRCGSIDPGVVLYLMDELKMDARAIERLIYQQSGLLGVSGISSDMRTLLASDAPDAKAAIDLYVYRIGRELGWAPRHSFQDGLRATVQWYLEHRDWCRADRVGYDRERLGLGAVSA